MRSALLCLAFMLAACDAGSGDPPCALLTDDTYTFSTSYITGGESVAQFEFQQEVRTYETGACEAPEADVSDVSLVVRNLTACVLDLNYRVSLISGGEGFTIEGNAAIQPGAAADQGIVQRNSPITINDAQAVLVADATRTNCP